MTGTENPLLIGWKTIYVSVILGCKPVAISCGFSNRNVYHRIVSLSCIIDEVLFEVCVFSVCHRCITYVSIRSWRTAQHHPGIIRVVVVSRIDESQELLFEPNIPILDHLIHNALHFFYEAGSFCVPLQFAELGFLSCYDFIIAKSHLIQQCLFVFFHRVLLILAKKRGRSGIQFRTFFFHKRGIRGFKLQFIFHQVIRSYIRGSFYRLMYAEIISDPSVFSIDGKPVSSIDITRQGGNIIVLTGDEAWRFGSIESKDGVCIAYFIDCRHTLLIPFYSGCSG